MEPIVAKSDSLALLIAEGFTVQDAAAKTGVSRTTVYRRLADCEFRQRVQTLRAGMIGDAVGRVSAAMTEAADVLRSLLKADSEAIRLGAARSLLDLGVKLREATEIEERVAELERRAADEGDEDEP